MCVTHELGVPGRPAAAVVDEGVRRGVVVLLVWVDHHLLGELETVSEMGSDLAGVLVYLLEVLGRRRPDGRLPG